MSYDYIPEAEYDDGDRGIATRYGDRPYPRYNGSSDESYYSDRVCLFCVPHELNNPIA